MSPFLADFQDMAPEKVKPHQHAGVEFLFVIKGSLTLKIGSEEFHLEPEDAIYFELGRAAQLPAARDEGLQRSNRYGAMK